MTQVDEVADYLTQHPGMHRPRDVARALGLSNHSTALTLNYLWRKDRIDRDQITHEGAPGPAYSLYGVADGNVRPTSVRQAQVASRVRMTPPTPHRERADAHHEAARAV